MNVETLGQAFDLGWTLTVACADGNGEGMKRLRECLSKSELDLQTLVWTRGRAFPLARLESRLKCPACGSRRVRLAFGVPAEPNKVRAAFGSVSPRR